MKKYQGTLIYSGKDDVGAVEVVETHKVRYLHFGTAVEQSSMLLDDPFALEMEYNKLMMASLLFQPDPRHVLFLGLGGASKQKFLWKHFPRCHLETVEWSPLVIEVSYNYFHLPRDQRMHIICDNAANFLNQSKKNLYDLIFIDLYTESKMSPIVSNEDFFKICEAKLKKSGLLVWNLWRGSSQELIEETIQNMSDVFGMNFLILTNQESSNYVLFIFKEPLIPYTYSEIRRNDEELKEKSGVDFFKILAASNSFKDHILFQDWVID